MKSSQINFYILPADWKEINNFCKKKGIKFIANPILQENSMFIDSIESTKPIKTGMVYLTSDEFKEKIRTDYIEKQRYFLVNDIYSYVIQFDKGGFYGKNLNELHRARLYYIKGYYDHNGIFINKDERFVEWASDVFKMFKKEFLHKNKEIKDYYFSQRAIDWINKNKAFLHPSGTSVKACV